MKINKGDPVRVRLMTGEVVDAVYDRPSYMLRKCHRVVVGSTSYLAVGGIWGRKGISCGHECRFVGPMPMVKKENNND